MSITKITYSMINGGPINVLDFGMSVINTDVQNAASLQAAINSLKNIGGTVLIPSGTYNITSIAMDSNDYKGIRIVGLSAELTKLNFTTTGTAISMNSATYIANVSWENMTIDAPVCNKMFHLRNGSQCSFRKIRTESCGNSGANAKAYHLQLSMATFFEEVSWVGVTKYGFYVEDDSDSTTFLHCYMKGFTTTDTTVVLTGGQVQAAHACTTMQDCIIGGGLNSSLHIATDNDAWVITLKNNYFETGVNAITLGNAAGVYYARNITIHNNYFYGFSNIGIWLRASKNVSIERNEFYAITGANVSINTGDVTKNTNAVIQYNTLTNNIERNDGQRNIRVQDYDESIKDYLSFYSAEKAWTPGTIANGGISSTTITVTGATLGWIATSSFSNSIGDMSISAKVTAANTVTVTITNNTGGSLSLSAGILRVMVIPFN